MNAYRNLKELALGIGAGAILIAAVGCDKGGNSSTGSNSSGDPTEPANLAGATAPATALPKESQSAHFAEVSKYLDLGGPFYGYIDIDGDLSDLGAKVNEFYAAIAETGEVPPVDITEILNEIGLQKVQALGGSSIKTPEGFRNKTFLYIPDGRSGILNLLGGDSEPLHYASLAPAGADLIIEQELNLKAVRDTAEKVVAKFNSPEIEEPFNEMLETKFADLSFSVADFLGNANGRVIIVASIVPDTPLPLPPDAPAIPSIDALLCVENAGWLFDSLEEKFITEGEGPFDFAEGDGFQKMIMQVPPDGSMGIYAPVIAKEESTDRVFLVSRQEYLDLCLGDGPRISGDAAFVAGIKDLPVEGNSFSYVSPEVYTELSKVIEGAMAQAGNMGGPPPEMMSAIETFATSFMPDLNNVGIAAVGQNLPNGILYTQNSVYSHKANLASAAVMPIAMVGGAMVPMMMARQNAAMMEMQAMQDAQMDQALGNPGDPFGGGVGPTVVEVDPNAGEFDERRGTVKMVQVFTALQGFAAENDGKFPDDIGTLVPDRLDPSSLNIQDQATGQSRPPIYLPGRTTSSKGDAVLLAAPWPDGDERFVIKVDGSSAKIREDEFQLQLISSQQ